MISNTNLKLELSLNLMCDNINNESNYSIVSFMFSLLLQKYTEFEDLKGVKI